MGAFEYIALDNAGKERKGVLEGDTPRHIRQLLRERQLLPVTVSEVAQKEATRQQSFSFIRRVAPADLSLFTRQLATLVRAGLPLEESLLAVSQQTEKPRVQSIILGVRSKVMEGHTLADGLTEFPQVFPEIYRATIAAGEQAGHLDSVLERLADVHGEPRGNPPEDPGGDALPHRAHGDVLHHRVGPARLRGAEGRLGLRGEQGAAAAGHPDSHRHQQFPQGIRHLAGHPRHHRGILFQRWLRNPDARRRYHRLQLRLPLVGKLARGFNTARFTRTFSILSAASVPVLEAMRIAGEVVTNLPMRDAVMDAAARVREGAPIGRSLSTASSSRR